MRRKIDSGRAYGGLYLLESGPSLSADRKLVKNFEEQQWHRQLLPPLFGLMQRLFPSLFSSVIIIILLVMLVSLRNIDGFLTQVVLIKACSFHDCSF